MGKRVSNGMHRVGIVAFAIAVLFSAAEINNAIYRDEKFHDTVRDAPVVHWTHYIELSAFFFMLSLSVYGAIRLVGWLINGFVDRS